MLGANPTIIINNLELTEEDLNQDAFTLYDAWVYFPDEVTNLAIGYEYSKELNVDEDGYLEIMKKNLVEDSGMNYKFVERTEETVANEKYVVGYFVLESSVYQRIYIRQIDENSMMFMIATYIDGGEAGMESFLGNIINA
jgi:hypothetical protein